ncbi:MAG TPA: phage tail tip lysozyme [Trebonia sp.]
MTAGQHRNGTRKVGRAAGPVIGGRHAAGRPADGANDPTAGRHADVGPGAGRYGGADVTIPGGLSLDIPPGRHSAPKRSFLRRKTARFRAGKAVPAAALAAALAVGAGAYGVMSTNARPPGEQAANLAVVPSGGYTLATGGALAAASSGKKQSSDAFGGLTGAVAAGMLRSQDVLAGVAKSVAAAQAAAQPTATASPSPVVTPSPQASSPAATPTVAPPAATTPAPATSSPTATSLTCNTSDGLLPDNVTAIVSFLVANGYSDNAAAGIAGNMYQESKGNPESEGDGGGGLIGWTPLPAGFVTGNPAADLQTQLSAVLTFNQQWSQYLPALNDAATPADAADIYVTDFERAGIPAASTREAAAQDVASACGI